MKIGITCYPTYGGSGIVATELGLELANRGHEIHFITYANPIRLDPGIPRIHYHEVEVSNYPLFQYPPYCLALASRMAEVAESYALDLLHVHYAIPHSISALLAQQMLSVKRRLPFITTLHGTDITLVGVRPLLFWDHQVFDRAVERRSPVSASYLRRATAEVFGVKERHPRDPELRELETLQAGREEGRSAPVRAQRREAADPPFEFPAGEAGEDCIRILARVVKATPAHLLMVGDGPDRGPAELLARELGVEEHVRFWESRTTWSA